MTIGKQHELHERRKGRNIGVLVVLLALVGLLFAVTVVKLGPNAINPTAGASWGERLEKWLTE